MSWYTDFKTGTKDHIAKGSGKKSKSKSYSYGASSWWMDDWDYSQQFILHTLKKRLKVRICIRWPHIVGLSLTS